MSAPAIVWTTLIGILAYVLAVEPSFFTYLMLQALRLVAFIQRVWVMICIHPDSPWVQHKIRSNADRIATQLLNEINDRPSRESNDDNHPG